MTGGPNRKLVRLVGNLTFVHHGEVERWLPVVGWEGLYEVSSLGAVRSLDREVEIEMLYGSMVRHTVRHYRGKILRQHAGPGTHGYLMVVLSRQGQPQKPRLVHQLVAEAFIGPRPPGEEVRHGPNGKLDNRASQLCYGTRKQNFEDRVRDGVSNAGERCGQAKLTTEIVVDIRRRVAAGESQRAVARRYDVTFQNVSMIITGKSWAVADGPVHAGHGRGEGNSQAKLTEASVVEIRTRAAAGESRKALALEYGVSAWVVRDVVQRKTWRHVA